MSYLSMYQPLLHPHFYNLSEIVVTTHLNAKKFKPMKLKYLSITIAVNYCRYISQAKRNLLPQLERMSLVNSLYTHAADDSVMENLK